MKIEESRRLIKEFGGNAVLLLSGGIDSILTLYLSRQFFDIPVITFAQDFSAEQWKPIEKLILEWNLTLYTFPPMGRYFVPNGEEVSLVDEYNLGGVLLPVIRDFEFSDRCSLELDTTRSTGVWLGWDAIFTGLLKDDTHSSTGGLVKSAVLSNGNVRFVSPLFEWTKEEVLEAATEFDLLRFIAPDTGEIKACSRCLAGKKVFCPKDNKEIPGFDWDRQGMLKQFQSKYGFEG